MYAPKTPNGVSFRVPLQCIWLKLNGSWPLASHAMDGSCRSMIGYCYTLWAWYVIISVCITICFQTAFLVSNFSDIMMTTENCCTTFMGALNFVRLLHLRLNQKSLRDILDQFAADIWITNSTMHRRIKTECQERMRIFRIMTALLACLILMYCFLPLIELFVILGIDAVEKPFPYKMRFPFNPYTNWLRYAITYIFTSYAGICVVTTLFAEDSILGFFITYTCGQFRILHNDIENLMEHVIKQENTQIQHAYLDVQKAIVKRHNKLIRFSQRLEDFFSPILLVNVIISSVLICVVGFQLATGKNMFIGDYVKFIVYISSSISQLYILCSNGDMLIQHSTSTATHLYACNWEGGRRTFDKHIWIKTPPGKQFRRNLEFMLLCSQRPLKITAFKFSTLSLQSFTAIMSTSMSYFTLLRSVYIDNN